MIFRALYCAALTCLAALAGCAARGPDSPGAPRDMLAAVTASLDAGLTQLDRELAVLAEAAGSDGMDPEANRDRLTAFAAERPWILAAILFDASGDVRVAAPEGFAAIEDANIGSEPAVAALLETAAPLVRPAAQAVEGIDSFDFLYPVHGAGGALIGGAALLVLPAAFVHARIEHILAASAWEVTIMEPTGYIVFSDDPEEIGRNVFSDGMYVVWEDLQALARRMAAEPRGSGRYKFLGRRLTTPVDKECYWDTVTLHGAPWRCAVHVARRAPLGMRGLD